MKRLSHNRFSKTKKDTFRSSYVRNVHMSRKDGLFDMLVCLPRKREFFLKTFFNKLLKKVFLNKYYICLKKKLFNLLLILANSKILRNKYIRILLKFLIRLLLKMLLSFFYVDTDVVDSTSVKGVLNHTTVALEESTTSEGAGGEEEEIRNEWRLILNKEDVDPEKIELEAMEHLLMNMLAMVMAFATVQWFRMSNLWLDDVWYLWFYHVYFSWIKTIIVALREDEPVFKSFIEEDEVTGEKTRIIEVDLREEEDDKPTLGHSITTSVIYGGITVVAVLFYVWYNM